MATYIAKIALFNGLRVVNPGEEYELELRYFERDPMYKYFNRKFEIYLLEKKTLKKNYILHMDNCDTAEGKWAPHIHKQPDVHKKLYFIVF